MNYLFVLLALAILIIYLSIVIVQQGTVAVITIFGKYARVMGPGLNFKIPFIEMIYRRISIQNRSVELSFQAITADQANVNFKAMLVYSVLNQGEETIKNVAFKFIDEASCRPLSELSKVRSVVLWRPNGSPKSWRSAPKSSNM